MTVSSDTNDFINNYKEHLQKQNEAQFEKIKREVEILERRDEIQIPKFKGQSLKAQSIELKIEKIKRIASKVRYSIALF